MAILNHTKYNYKSLTISKILTTIYNNKKDNIIIHYINIKYDNVFKSYGVYCLTQKDNDFILHHTSSRLKKIICTTYVNNIKAE